MTEAQKKAVEVQKEIEEACIRHGLNLTIFENGIGFVDPKDNKIVMVWRPKYKPAPSETVRRKYVRFHIWRFKGKWQIYGKQKETYSQRNETEVG